MISISHLFEFDDEMIIKPIRTFTTDHLSTFLKKNKNKSKNIQQAIIHIPIDAKVIRGH